MSMGYKKRRSVTLLALGGFFVNVIVQLVNPLLKITVCSVNQFQWPITKDTPIIRMGQRTFFFAFPGLLYALQFPRVCGPTVVAYLVRLFNRFSYYQYFAEVSTVGSVAGYPCSDNEPTLWNIVRPLAEPMAHEILLLFGHRPGGPLPSLASPSKTPTTSHLASPHVPQSHCNNAWYPSPGFRVWRLNDVGVINFVRGLDAAVKNEEECVLSKTVEESSSDEEKGEEVTSNVDDMGEGKQVMP
ncbi:hypothetical protein G2W53_008474 [Senna tora]|uniref:Uncharacterized protein n=1 Tax=Senna tora TaxID=362788 RepID=A0A834X942_9FABA|nr:hypothetical protein G2W53_008474 [Senna tora]